MSYHFKILPALDLMLERWEGRFDEAGLLAAVRASAEHPDYRPRLRVIADFSAAHLDLSYAEMRSFARSISGDLRLATGRVAFVVGRDLEWGMIRMFQALTEASDHWEAVEIFEDLQDACDWLGLPSSVELPGLMDP